MKSKIKSTSKFWYPTILIITAVLSYGYSITHFAIGVDDTAVKLFMDEGLSVCSNRWTLFFLNRVLHFHITDWPTWLVEGLAVCILALSLSLWIYFLKKVLVCVEVVLPGWFYGLAAALALSCPILSEIWVYYLHGGVAIGYGLTALALLLFLQAVENDCRHSRIKILGSGLCLAAALGCYETMMDCYLIGACIAFMLLHALSDKTQKAVYDIRFFPWMIRGGMALVISMLTRALMHEILMWAYHLDNMAKYGMNDYNPMFGDLFVIPGALGMLIKKLYLRYYVNAAVYLPITFLVLAWIIIGAFAVFYTVKKRNLWIFICVPAMMSVPVLSSIVAGKAKAYHSAQYVPLIIMAGFLLFGIMSVKCKNIYFKMLMGGGVRC